MVTYAVCSAPDLLSSALSDYEEPPFFVPRSAKINVTPYLGARIEYQYPNEPKQTIYSNGGELSYTFEQEKGRCRTYYYIGCSYVNSDSNLGLTCGTYLPARTHTSIVGPLEIVKMGFYDIPGSYAGSVRAWVQAKNLITGEVKYYPFGRIGYYRSVRLDPGCAGKANWLGIGFAETEELTNVTIYRADGLPDDCGNCVFTVSETFESGASVIRHEEARKICPSVQQFGCIPELENIQTYNVNLEPLEALFITTSSEFALQNGTVNEGFDLAEIINFIAGNPDNCILIWKLERSFGFFYSITQIAQICSFAGCPPPEYSYECLDPCRSCPPNTCAIECGAHVCCYDSEGIAVESIPIGEYCNE